MLSTRRIALALLAVLVLPMPGHAADDPAETVRAIYRRATDPSDSGGQFLWVEKANRRAAFTRRTADLWDRAEANTPKGDMAPMEFDPVTASQDPQVTGFSLSTKARSPGSATVAVTLKGPSYRHPDDVVLYDLAESGGRWRIDDIHGSVNGSPWSVRAILAASLKR